MRWLGFMDVERPLSLWRRKRNFLGQSEEAHSKQREEQWKRHWSERGPCTFKNLKIPQNINFSERRREMVGRGQIIGDLTCNAKEVVLPKGNCHCRVLKKEVIWNNLPFRKIILTGSLRVELRDIRGDGKMN